VNRISSLINDHAYHWHGYGTYCGRCLRDCCAPHGGLTPLIDIKGVQCRACGRLLRSSHAPDHTGLARIRALTGADQAGWALAEVDRPYEEYWFPPAHAALRDSHKGRVA